MSELIAAFAGFATPFEQAIHGADRAEILSFIEQRRINSGGRAILEAFSMQMCQDRFAFRWSKSAWRGMPPVGLRRADHPTPFAIVGSPRRQQRTAISAASYAGV